MNFTDNLIKPLVTTQTATHIDEPETATEEELITSLRAHNWEAFFG